MSDKKYFGKYRGMVINNLYLMQMGRIDGAGARYLRSHPLHLGDAVLPGYRQNKMGSLGCCR